MNGSDKIRINVVKFFASNPSPDTRITELVAAITDPQVDIKDMIAEIEYLVMEGYIGETFAVRDRTKEFTDRQIAQAHRNKIVEI